MEIKIIKKILGSNEKKAAENRRLLDTHKVFMINLIGSPGAGKTSMLEKTLGQLAGKYSCAVIEGDIATDRDARRLQKYNIPVALINTDGACHLEAVSVAEALAGFNLPETDFIFIENVGNLVCPAEFDLGEHAKCAVASVPEGDDKPAKYPGLFRAASVCLLNKIDLAPYVKFDVAKFLADIKNIKSDLPVFQVSAAGNINLDEWIEWLEKCVKKNNATGQI
ncbi:MAG: hydrogenase accessory protein HypB [Spirochaetes bacterium GWF1_41_5]|nr:MAG: hydrogenase accessory protein HypB [Spirochaetes bacterium GWF1_41_5]HBE03140.1 hydrogenase accessory protein HypB [Spirochaetia bacterium]